MHLHAGRPHHRISPPLPCPDRAEKGWRVGDGAATIQEVGGTCGVTLGNADPSSGARAARLNCMPSARPRSKRHDARLRRAARRSERQPLLHLARCWSRGEIWVNRPPVPPVCLYLSGPTLTNDPCALPSYTTNGLPHRHPRPPPRRTMAPSFSCGTRESVIGCRRRPVGTISVGSREGWIHSQNCMGLGRHGLSGLVQDG